MPVKQAERPVELITPLGADVLVFQHMTGGEQLGKAFEYRIEALSETTEIDLNALLGKRVTVRVDLPPGGKRYFNGYVTRAAQIPSQELRLARFELTINPWISLLSRTSDCRIFQEKSAPDIVKEVFRDNGFSDFEDRLTGSYRTREFCVQYRETDFDFVHRLMEEEGIYYYTNHQNGSHKLVLADSKGSHDLLESYSDIPYYPQGNIDQRDKENIYKWTWAKLLKPGKVALNDFDFKIPRKELKASKAQPRSHAYADFEIYDYPGRYVEHGDGEEYARKRIESLQAGHDTASATTNVRGVALGRLFTLSKHERSDQNKQYLITEFSLVMADNPYETGSADEHTFEAQLTLLDAQTPFRPERATPRPMIRGPQTAIVVGPAGEEIHTDDHGRVKCQFHWDRYGGFNENSSCWIRVSHPWAGKNWGAIAIPRIGQEVVVEYEEGDPDRPIITGRVYNGDQRAPYGLPGDKVISGIKSNSTKGGGGYNEFIMNDTKGDELIRLHAQYDMDSTIEHDERRTVHNNRTVQVDVNHSETVGNNQDVSIGKNQTLTVGNDQTVTIGSNQTTMIGSMQSITIGSSQTLNVGTNQTNSIGTSQTNNIGATQTNNIGASQSSNVGGSRSITVATSQTHSVGSVWSANVGSMYSLNAGGVINLNAAAMIKLKVGGSSIVISSSGITIKGMNITIKGAAKTSVKGAMTTVDGSGILKLGGGIIKIG